MLRFNTDLDSFEGYDGVEWGEIGGGGGGATGGGFLKADPDSVAFTKTGNDTAEIKAGTTVAFSDGSQVNFDTATAITMPTLSAGTDYAIWVAPDGTIETDTSFTTAPTAGGRRIGGFHYAPGGNASFSLNAGDGGTTPQINEFSFYDLKWRPSVADPRITGSVHHALRTFSFLPLAPTKRRRVAAIRVRQGFPVEAQMHSLPRTGA